MFPTSTSSESSRTLAGANGGVLALAVELREPLALLDDGLGRRHARLLGIPFTGTLGVLLRAKASGYIPEVRPTIERLERLGFRLDIETRNAVLALAGEGLRSL